MSPVEVGIRPDIGHLMTLATERPILSDDDSNGTDDIDCTDGPSYPRLRQCSHTNT